jgi:hypothetical protein
VKHTACNYFDNAMLCGKRILKKVRGNWAFMTVAALPHPIFKRFQFQSLTFC